MKLKRARKWRRNKKIDNRIKKERERVRKRERGKDRKRVYIKSLINCPSSNGINII